MINAEAPRRRGRPRGTGHNDTKALIRVMSLLDATPDLTPTTAIRRSGIDHPSDIRRIRDKLRRMRQ